MLSLFLFYLLAESNLSKIYSPQRQPISLEDEDESCRHIVRC
ncbi:hypothetical protein CLOLEP_00687 [[Clostridium] leptum DSM 753]|uniref:Uncharacterized protein n=1 Tax=[Clostridium] leptum DSM 753 TaxID=428125 RepID=A7VQ61_9FIRM|nr:hypothetical protein CLOLEP_00687 [[Clostridium] leptum DSM 753]